MSIDIQKFTADELTLEKLDTLAMRHESFQVVAVSNISAVVEKIEGRLEKQDLKCRVYSEYRSAAMAATRSSGSCGNSSGRGWTTDAVAGRSSDWKQ